MFLVDGLSLLAQVIKVFVCFCMLSGILLELFWTQFVSRKLVHKNYKWISLSLLSRLLSGLFKTKFPL